MITYKEWLDTEEKKGRDRVCYCGEDKAEPPTLCEGCRIWYHASCLYITLEEIHDDALVDKNWHCAMCGRHKTFVTRAIENIYI